MKRGVVQGRFSISRILPGRIWLLIGIVVLLTIGCTTAQTHSSNDETPWQIVRGQQQAKLWSTEGLLGLTDPRIYVATGASSSAKAPDRTRLFLTETLQYGSYAPDFVWKQENLATRPQVWQVQLPSFQVTPIAFESFQSFKPEPQQEVSKPLSPKRFPQLKLAGTEKVRASSSTKPTILEIRGYTKQGKRYAIALSLSDYQSSTRQEYFTGWEGYPFGEGKPGWRLVTYYSGTFHLEVFDVANPTQAVIHLQKQVKNWAQYPRIANFGETVLLPNGVCKLFCVKGSNV